MAWAPGCDPTKYPPAGGDGKGDNPCDDWPVVNPPVKVKGCHCPPRRWEYVNRGWALGLNLIPFVGQAINIGIGPVPDCTEAFTHSSNSDADAQTELVYWMDKTSHAYAEVVGIMGNTFQVDPRTGAISGILATAIDVAMQPAVATATYLRIIGVAIVFVLVGVLFAL